jgi:uncharacterized membrane protein (UPF0127 family)
LRSSAALLLIAALAACASGTSSSDAGPEAETSSSPASTSTAATTVEPSTSGVAPSTSVPADGRPVGFTTVTARITAADGDVCEVCLWLADTPDERARGLMEVTTLGPASGMVFVFDQETSGAFYMFDTPTPLSIAWFAAAGPLVGTAEMEPCLGTPAGACPLYAPGAPYRYALEVFAGGLDELGVGPGSSFELVEGTEADSCPDPAPT